ncbi:PTS sugar transporter subunit IIA [Oceanobacillus jeddahense]|uniref:PTS sugar transporter subunit IIA n=1 Tax=Oceanobacillus jeddahense TaxID=1462527 RepID=A0ABY5JQH9_9BACI|nr:PTS sugar transporter subunit IIA [Oceanobacillus jeddahense]UUI02371.1 PTS sugar transporter subunit IIA [Oceanobacillus jeddahense]
MADGFGILVMTHGDFGKAAMDSAQLIVGEQENYETISVFVVDNLDDLKQEMEEKVKSLDTSKGLVILTDIVGGTPINLASNLLTREDTIIASGVNLPLLLEVLMNRGKEVSELEEVIRAAYAQGLSIRTNKDLEGDDDDDLL